MSTSEEPRHEILKVKMLTVQETAQRLGISTSLVYSLCANRKIRHERHGLGRGKILIPEDALEEYRQRHTLDVEERPTASASPLRHITSQ